MSYRRTKRTDQLKYFPFSRKNIFRMKVYIFFVMKLFFIKRKIDGAIGLCNISCPLSNIFFYLAFILDFT